MFYVKFLVPVTDKAGQAVRSEAWDRLAGRILDVVGGFQQTRVVAGAWRSDSGQVFHEESREYVMALDSMRQVADFLALVDWAAAAFAQAAMFVEVAGIPEVLAPPG
ncbi:MAG: hypothetical protein DK306_000849 [Chloroflexi bacterium]|jgi:hypothetical protein|nr:MAG: hypothetical protein DK306_000849 [Chloroflexota bacterium]